MTGNRLPDYLDHMLEAVQLAWSYVEGLDKEVELVEGFNQCFPSCSFLIS